LSVKKVSQALKLVTRKGMRTVAAAVHSLFAQTIHHTSSQVAVAVVHQLDMDLTAHVM
jgi:hypothetical protein